MRRGTIHALIGPNGAGKTTCFNLLTKFLRPSSGRIEYGGHDITHATPADIARMGLVRSFQISAVFPHLTALENVRVALQRKMGSSFHFWKSERVLEGLGEDAVKVQTYFITVDPERDTPAVLQDYVPHFDPRIGALSGDLAAIQAAADSVGAAFSKTVPARSPRYSTARCSAA